MDNNTKKDTLDLQEIPLDIALKVGDIFSFDCYIKLHNGKMIKISHGDGSAMIDMFEKYRAKGVEKFYATKEDLLKFLKIYQQTFSQKIFDPKTTEMQKVQTLNTSFEILKESFSKLGFTPLVIETAENTAKESLRFIRNVPNLFNFFKNFKKNCNDEFMQAMMINYTTSIILEHFDWSSSDVKKKLSLAVMLSDITLSKDEIELLRKYEESDPTQLPDKIYNHPIEIANIIRNSRHYGVPAEVAQIIEQHHELPDNKGFPNRIDHARITLFSAVQIVSTYFIKEVVAAEFDMRQLPKIIQHLNTKFHKGNYGKVMKILEHTLSI